MDAMRTRKVEDTRPVTSSPEDGARVVVALMPYCAFPESLAMVLTRNANNIEDTWWIA